MPLILAEDGYSRRLRFLKRHEKARHSRAFFLCWQGSKPDQEGKTTGPNPMPMTHARNTHTVTMGKEKRKKSFGEA